LETVDTTAEPFTTELIPLDIELVVFGGVDTVVGFVGVVLALSNKKCYYDIVVMNLPVKYFEEFQSGSPRPLLVLMTVIKYSSNSTD